MNAKKFSVALGNVRDDYVREAIEYQCSKKRRSWTKWAIAALEYNGAVYEVLNIPEVLEKYGLPAEITSDMAGKHLSYLKSDGGIGYECTPLETDMELYQYVSAVCDGVYVLRDGDTWYAVLFCNFHQFDSNMNCELTELYRMYGIENEGDIASIAEVDWQKDNSVGVPVTERQEITEFYNMTVALLSYGNDDFQNLTFGDVSEESVQEAHTAFADDLRILRVETSDGLCFFLSFFPNYNWIRSSGTMSYYRIDNQMREWINRNLR